MNKAVVIIIGVVFLGAVWLFTLGSNKELEMSLQESSKKDTERQISPKTSRVEGKLRSLSSNSAGLSEFFLGNLRGNENEIFPILGKLVDQDNLFFFQDALKQVYLKMDISSAIEILESLRDIHPQLHEKVLVELLRENAQTGKASDLVTFLKQSNNEVISNLSAIEVGEQFAGSEPQENLNYFRSLEDSRLKEELITGIARQWMRDDVNAAAEYILENGDSPYFDDAKSRLGLEIGDIDPEIALAWVDTITNEDQKMVAMEDVASHWYNRERQEYYTWLRNQPLEMQNRLRALEPSWQIPEGDPNETAETVRASREEILQEYEQNSE